MLQDALHDALHAFGPQAAHILDLWRFTLLLCTLVFGAVLVAFVWAVWRARRAAAGDAPPELSSPASKAG
jgi:cytochrome c oxidase subunit 2